MTETAIEQMLVDAQEVLEPGSTKTGQMVDTGDVKAPVPMATAELTSAGWCYIYDTRTGDRSRCNRNMLTQHLKLKRPDGTAIFTTVDPHIPVKVGAYKCLLHADNPNRKHYDGMGLPTCRKANLTSPFQVRRHMMKRHPQEWATIEQERTDAEKQHDREFQEKMLSRVAEAPKPVGTPEAPLYVSDKPRIGRPPKP